MATINTYVRGTPIRTILTLRRARSARLEGWDTPRSLPILRDAALRAAPQDEFVCGSALNEHEY
jgi:hypothetical protein